VAFSVSCHGLNSISVTNGFVLSQPWWTISTYRDGLRLRLSCSASACNGIWACACRMPVRRPQRAYNSQKRRGTRTDVHVQLVHPVLRQLPLRERRTLPPVLLRVVPAVVTWHRSRDQRQVPATTQSQHPFKHNSTNMIHSGPVGQQVLPTTKSCTGMICSGFVRRRLSIFVDLYNFFLYGWRSVLEETKGKWENNRGKFSTISILDLWDRSHCL